MRLREVGVFVIGFSAGALCLAAVLWFGGAIRPASHTIPGPQIPAPDVMALYAAPPPAPKIPPPSADPATSAGQPSRELAIPVAGVSAAQLTDTFSDARAGHRHEALDIPAPRGTPVIAADEGNVVKLFTSKQGGLTVYQFDDSGNWCYYYAHLDRYAPSLKEGMLLRKGDVLGYVGTTGDAPPNAPHLHFAIFRLGPEKHWWHGTAINPFPLLKRR